MQHTGAWSGYKKLGTHLDEDADTRMRIAKANQAFQLTWKVWRCDKVRPATRMKMYNAYVKSILMYSIGAVAFSAAQLSPLVATHRRQQTSLSTHRDTTTKSGHNRCTMAVFPHRFSPRIPWWDSPRCLSNAQILSHWRRSGYQDQGSSHHLHTGAVASGPSDDRAQTKGGRRLPTAPESSP